MSAPYNILRNDVTLTLSEQTFGKKSDNAGVKFWAPVIDVTVPDQVKWVGADQLNAMANKNLRLIFADIYLDNIERNKGVFDEDEFREEAADFTAARQSLADLQDQIDDLQALQQSYTIDSSAWEGFDPAKGLNEAQTKLMGLITEGNAKIKALRLKRDSIQKEYTIRAEKRKATKAAKAAAAEAAKATAGQPVA